jgi:hypothetical protein
MISEATLVRAQHPSNEQSDAIHDLLWSSLLVLLRLSKQHVISRNFSPLTPLLLVHLVHSSVQILVIVAIALHSNTAPKPGGHENENSCRGGSALSSAASVGPYYSSYSPGYTSVRSGRVPASRSTIQHESDYQCCIYTLQGKSLPKSQPSARSFASAFSSSARVSISSRVSVSQFVVVAVQSRGSLSIASFNRFR